MFRSYIFPPPSLPPNFISFFLKTTQTQRDMNNHAVVISLCGSCLTSYTVTLCLAWGRQASSHFNLGTGCGMEDAS